MDTKNDIDLEDQIVNQTPLSYEPDPDEEEAPAPEKKKKKGKLGLIIFLIIVVLAAAAGAAWYFMQRQKPISTVEDYLADVEAMNFDGMKTLLQSNDLSALDDASITDEAYTAFFQSINKKLSYDITKTKFNLSNGTAQVTARITYIDATDIYKEAMTDFLKQIVSSAFAGEPLSEEEIQAQLASLLAEKAETTEDNFVEEDITYPLIEADGKWKIVSLDSDTVRIMSGNFTNVQDEINASLETAEDSTGDTSESAPSASEGDVIDMSNDRFSIHYTKAAVGEDWAGEPCILVYYDYTNNSSTSSSAMVDVTLRAYQNGEVLEAAIPASNDTAVDNYMTEVGAGQTLNVCQVFSLKDSTTDVTLEASEGLSYGVGETTTQILPIK